MKFGIIVVILVFLLANFYIFQRFWTIMPPNTVGRILLISFAVVVVLSLFVFFVAGERLPIPLSSLLYTIGTSWFFISIYFLMLALLQDFIRVLHITPSGTFSHYTRDNWAGLIFIVGFVTMLMVCGYLKYKWKVRVEVPVTTEKKLENRSSLRIVAISDLHLGYTIGRSELNEWIALINKEKPDIVLIGGDIIDNSVRPLEAFNIAEYFSAIEAPYGIYACMGNHEYISNPKKSEAFMKQAGINMLRDSSVLIDSCFYVVGRDDRSNPNRKPLKELIEPLDKSKFLIVLDHQPYHLEEAEQAGVDLQFSGHTHRGQVWPVSFVTDRIYEVSHGYKKKGNTNIYVSSGIGIWGGKFRIGTQSEYVVIDIKQQ